MKDVKEPETCKGCGNVPEHCMCDLIDAGIHELKAVIADKKRQQHGK